MRNRITLVLKGLSMGIAETIPGVSGGTIAFITGIYETLLDCIRAFNPSLIRTLRTEGLPGLWRAINGNFLVLLMVGMVVGIAAGTFMITYLLENYPVLLWSFFFGLIIASAVYVGRQLTRWGALEIVLLIIGTVLVYYVTVAAPSSGSQALWYVYISGVVAISALILPGLSGSFILLLMGMYSYIIPTLKNVLQTFDTGGLVVLAVFGAGALTGLLTFSHLLSWTFKHFRNQTLALLTGFLIGSLNKIWPWQQVTETRVNSKGEEVVQFSQSVLPGTFETLDNNFLYGNDPYLFGAILLMIIGFVVVFVLERFDAQPTEAS